MQGGTCSRLSAHPLEFSLLSVGYVSELWTSTTSAEAILEGSNCLSGKNEAEPWDFAFSTPVSGPQILCVYQNPMEDTTPGF